MTEATARSTANPDEIEKFSALAETWWDPTGPFKPLHKFNPARLKTIVRAASDHFGRDPKQPNSFNGLSAVDVGCGGGLVAEPLSNIGFSITGIDASAKNIGIASAHAAQSGASVQYLAATPENLADDGKTFDLVLALEIIEHVEDLEAFYDSVTSLVADGGLLVLATLNRTTKSLLLAKIGAEYILRWLPRGTHDWRKFIKPSEMAAALRPRGFIPSQVVGFQYNPLTDIWSEGSDTAVNYMIVAKRS